MDKWYYIFMIAFFAMIFGGMAYKEKLYAQAKITCYEAAKTNANIKCRDE